MALRSQFLASVIGVDGVKALTKALVDHPELADAVFPRTLIAWVRAISSNNFNGKVPGTETELLLQKTESGFSGRVLVADGVIEFNEANLARVVATIAVGIGEEICLAPMAKNLVKLGQSLDMLVKAQVLKKNQEKKGQKGAVAAPIGPMEQQKTGGTVPLGTKGQAHAPERSTVVENPHLDTANVKKPSTPKPPKLPGVKPKKPKNPSIKVDKSEAGNLCYECGKGQFVGKQYVGCECFETLAKGVKVSEVGTSMSLSFDSSWDVESILVLARVLGK